MYKVARKAIENVLDQLFVLIKSIGAMELLTAKIAQTKATAVSSPCRCFRVFFFFVV